MKAFHTVAIPHKDILEGNLNMDVFAANLWDVYNKTAPEEYQNREEFFKKTYETKGLTNILNIVQKRLEGKGGDAIIQLQTPFGGGKTHSLIAMYHKACELGVKTSVIVGTALHPEEKTLWELLEEQLTGKIEKLKGRVSPGSDAIKEILSQNEPVLILMDEVLEYITKAAGVKVGDTTLASQTIAFMQELTEAVSRLDKVALVITLPSSTIEHYDEQAEKLFQQIQKITGRVEIIHTPVQDNEIAHIIRRRLFSKINFEESDKIIDEFIEYAKMENLIPAGMEVSEYRAKFKESYPFLPEVIDVLYTKWGSFPTFQRTRGVLRLLSLVVHCNKDKNIPYVSLADFDLSNQEIRRELLKHIDSQYDSVIAEDIIQPNSGAKRVDLKIGDAYKGLKLGTRTCTTIFMYSFSGGKTKGATKNEIKRSATTLQNPASVIGEVLDNLKNTLYYLQYQDERYLFTNQPNLNHILLVKMENISNKDIEEFEKDLLNHAISSSPLKTYIWKDSPKDIPDDMELKLVILKNKDENTMKNIIGYRGNIPRVYKNTIFFLTPVEAERLNFSNFAKKYMAYDEILKDTGLNLSKEQKTEISNKIKELKKSFNDYIRNLYRVAYLPAKEGICEMDLGVPTSGSSKPLNEEIYDKLVSNGKILKNMSPMYLTHKYLKNCDYANINNIYRVSLNTPGEVRFIDKNVILNAVKLGVETGIFGIGEEIDGKIKCRYFNEKVNMTNIDYPDCCIIKKGICVQQKKEEKEKLEIISSIGNSTVESQNPDSNIGNTSTSSINTTSSNPSSNIHDSTNATTKTAEIESKDVLNSINISFEVGKLSDITQMLRYINSKFKDVKINITIQANNGEISKEDYDNKIKETLIQLGRPFKENNK